MSWRLRFEAERLGDRLERGDRYWPAQLAVAAAIALNFVLSERVTVGPTWLLPSVEGVLLLALVVGRFAFTCRTTAVLADNDARERCVGWGRTPDGRLHFAGPSRRSDPTHAWTISAPSGAYRRAHGRIVARDVGDRESLLTITITPRAGVVLRSGVLDRPSANRAFRGRADALCATAASQLAALPPFPFSTFDVLHPDPTLLPSVGQFFTGPHDPRPILRTLDAHLRALGRPPADRDAWGDVLAARAAALAVNDEQDQAALAANAPAFVKSVHDAARTFRAVAIASTVFGVSRCVL